MVDQSLNIVIGGEAGQGLVTLGYLLTRALVHAGYRVVVTQDYQSRIRGGHNTYTIRVAAEEINAPRESIDILVALDDLTIPIHAGKMAPGAIALIDSASSVSVESQLRIPFADLAPPRFLNMVGLGVVGALLGMRMDSVEAALQRFFHGPEIAMLEGNREALGKGYGWMSEQNGPRRKLPNVGTPVKRLTLNGNEAMALGALASGLKFFSFYPMTPATSIAVSLASYAERMGIIVEQAEDEIAAINMAIGASFMGSPSMVATSGGGFALMAEGVSLAGMTETPIVIVVAQRPGPSTGLPTRTEQADLEFVLHAGHGEFPRAVFAPGSVEECFHLIGKALRMAEKSRGPVFLLTDQFLADSYHAVDPFDLEAISPMNTARTCTLSDDNYLPYKITNSGVSGRILPGLAYQFTVNNSGRIPLVIADSDEHSEDGHLTEDLDVRRKMVDKRLRKIRILKDEAIPPDIYGDGEPDILIISWGSTKGSATEAVSTLRGMGVRTASAHISQPWPLASATLMGLMEKAQRVVCIESNATGQMARLIRRETGFEIKERVLRYDGAPITPDYILGQLALD